MILSIEKQVCSLDLAMRLKDVNGYEGIYQISDLGIVYSLSRENGMGSRTKTKCLSFKLNKGYKSVTLSKNSKLKCFFIHRLVANAFLKKKEGAIEVNHKDGNKLNNHYLNLEWVTKSENQQHARKMFLIGGEKTNTAKLTVNKVKEIRKLYPSLNSRELSEKFGVGQSTICKIIKKQYWKYV